MADILNSMAIAVFNGHGAEPTNLQVQPEPSPPRLCPRNNGLDFSQTSSSVKMVVFWICIPMLLLNICLFLAMVVYMCTRATRIIKANILTQCQFCLLTLISLVSTVLLGLFAFSTRHFILGENPDRTHVTKKMTRVGMFLFGECASGARFCYGSLSFLVGLSAYVIGYR